MTAADFLRNIRVDGRPIDGEVMQVTLDAEQTTLVYDVPRPGAEPARRVITVETGAISID